MKKYFLWCLLFLLSFGIKAQDIAIQTDNEHEFERLGTSNPAVVCPNPGGLVAYNILSTSANLGWNGSVQNVLFEVQYKPVTSATWTTLTDITSDGSSGGVSLSNLLPNTTYEWKVKTICDIATISDFVIGNNFTTVCNNPGGLVAYNILSTSVNLGWNGSEQNVLFEVQYKAVSSSTWITITNIPSDGSSGGIILSNLLPNTIYQWKVKTICTSGNPSNFVVGNNFTTVCNNPGGLVAYNILSTSVNLGWNGSEQNVLFEVQYKDVSSSTWITITNIPSDGSSGGIILSNLLPNTIYQWKVKTICTSGNPSNFVVGNNFTTVCNNPGGLVAYNILSTSVNLGWNGNEQNVLFEVEYKAVSSSTWIIITNIPSNGTNGGISLSNLSPNVVYQWKVRVLCSTGNPSNFVIGNNFTTLCTAPTGLGNGNVTLTSADLIWLSVSAGISYEVRYRVQGSNTAWTTQTVNAPTPTPNTTIIHPISGLSPQTSYEWQVRTLCSPLNTTFSSLATFTTACPVPTSLNTSDITSNSAKLNWNLGISGATSDLQWRLVGSNTWTTIAGLTTGTYTLTGLTVGASYQWQVRTNCSVSVSSAYSTPLTFVTICPLPTNLSISNLTASSAQLNWSGAYAGGNYSVQWRLQSSGVWTTVNNLSTASYTLTGLTAGAIYEWQVKLLCTPSITTTYAGPSSFTTATTCSNMFTLKNGLWNDPTVWSCNRIPNSTDVVLIKNIITVPSGYTAQAQQITYDQGPTVKFLQAAQLNFLH